MESVRLKKQGGGRDGRMEAKGRNDEGRKTHLTIFCIESEVNLFSSCTVYQRVSVRGKKKGDVEEKDVRAGRCT
jgi:hypothetical protein